MSPIVLQDIRLGPSPLDRVERLGFWPLIGIWALLLGLVVTRLFVPVLPGRLWPEGGLLIASCLVTLANTARHLPVQNVIGVAFLAGGLGGLAHGMTATTGIPFGPCVYSRDIGRLVFDFLPWPMPFVWIAFLLASRGTARLVLQPLRSHGNYGYYVYGLTLVLMILLEAGLELFAVHRAGYWDWRPTRIPVNFFGVPLVNFLGWLVWGGLILAFATPLLIRKSPKPAAVKRDLLPLIVWGGMAVVFGIAASGVVGNTVENVRAKATTRIAANQVIADPVERFSRHSGF